MLNGSEATADDVIKGVGLWPRPVGVVLGAAASIVAEMGDNCSAQLKNCNTCCQPVEASLQFAAHHVLTLAITTALRQ